MKPKDYISFEHYEYYENAKQAVEESQIKMLNSEYIRSFMTDRELAELLVQQESYDEFDSDCFGNIICTGTVYSFIAMDGSIHSEYEDAVDATMKYLAATAIEVTEKE